MEYGILSLLPVLTVLVVAISTKRTLMALFIGSVVGCVLIAKAGLFNAWLDYLYQSMADPNAEWLIVVTCLFGVLVALFEKSGAVDEFAIWTRHYVTSRRKSLLLTYVLGFVIFLDDYLNNLVVGTAMKPMTDKYQVPRTQLAYVVNSTAAPVCLLIPISTWAVFFGTLMEGEGITVNGSGIGAYISALPLIFYGWVTLILVLLVVLGVFPLIGPMRKQDEEAKKNGRVFPLSASYDEASKQALNRVERGEAEESEAAAQTKASAKPYNFLLPILVMIVVTIIMDIDVLAGTAAGIITSVILILVQRKMKFFKVCESIFDGFANMVFVVILVLLAYMLQKINLDLQLAEYVISVVKPLMHGGLLPAAVFVLCAVYAYATGCFWDLAAIIIPIVIPLAVAMDVDPILAGAAVFSGAGFGSNTCLYGDAMILVSKSTDLQPVDSMLATLPFALISGGISVVLYLVFGFIML